MITEISSLQHPLVKKWVKLRLEKKAREEEGLVLLTGEKMIRDLAKKKKLQALISERDEPDIAAAKRYIARKEILRKITGTLSPDGFVALAELPKPRTSLLGKRILILDQIQDPGNLGTILRSAQGLGWDGALLTPQTVDPFNDKALRASQGALFSLPFAWEEGEIFVEKTRPFTYLADLHGTSLAELTWQTPLALILSNEGSGPSSWAKKLGKKVSIPMQNGVDSLNVAASGAIFLYAMRPT